MNRYTKKPVTIEAVQWDGTAAGAGPIIDWILAGGGTARYHEVNETVERVSAQIAIDTLEGTITASPGDWIIRGVQSEHYPCKPDIFDATYDPEQEGMQTVSVPAGHLVIALDPEASVGETLTQFVSIAVGMKLGG